MEASYITSAAKAQQLPRYSLPEVAFVGRSNVGKSTLLNALLGRKNLARASRTPGRTQMINFFDVGGRLILADLPGYGFSSARREVSEHWQELVDEYMKRPNIKEFLFLIDSRRDPTDEDIDLLRILGAQLPVVVIATKVDKLSRAETNAAMAHLAAVITSRDIPLKKVIGVSVLKKTGLEELRKSLHLG